MTVPLEHAGAVLTVDLAAIVENWRRLGARLGKAGCAAVVKANAYGLGAAAVGGALAGAGCRDFFVAHLDEGIALRRALQAQEIRIFVLNGTPKGTEADFVAARLVPVVNTMGELTGWREHARALGRRLPVVLQVDSGMSRLGLTRTEVAAIAAEPAVLEGLSIELVMSHLACADEPGHAANEAQRREFRRLAAMLPPAPLSLANSSGIFLGYTFHGDLVRPGAALYGVNPTPGLPNPMLPVVGLAARVVQIRDVPAGAGIGYGHTASAARPSRLVTISLGYADGWPRNAAAAAFAGGERLPFIGRVSMDTIVLDATGCRQPLREDDMVEVICPGQDVDAVADIAGTIGYEILTRLGSRFHRIYAEGSMPLAQTG